MGDFVGFEDDEDDLHTDTNESHKERRLYDKQFRRELGRSWSVMEGSRIATPKRRPFKNAMDLPEARGRKRDPRKADVDLTEDSSTVLRSGLSPRPCRAPPRHTDPQISPNSVLPLDSSAIHDPEVLPNPMSDNAMASSSRPLRTAPNPSGRPSIIGPRKSPFIDTAPPKEMLKICKAWEKYQKDQKKKPIKVISSLLEGLEIGVVMSFKAGAVITTKWKLLQENSAVLSLRYLPTVTHLLVESSLGPSDFFKFVGVKKVDDIAQSVEILKWDWFPQSKKYGLQLSTDYQYFPERNVVNVQATTTVPAKRKSTTGAADLAGKAKRPKPALSARYDPTDSDTSQSMRYPPPANHAGGSGLSNKDEEDHAIPSPDRPDRKLPNVDIATGQNTAKRMGNGQPSTGVGERWRTATAEEADGLDLMIDGLRTGAVTEGKNGEVIMHTGHASAGLPIPANDVLEGERSDTDDDAPEPRGKVQAKKRGKADGAMPATTNPRDSAGPYKYQQASDGKKLACPNENIAVAIEKLEQLYANDRNKNQFQKRAYEKAAGILRRLPYRVTSREMALGIQGLGGGLADRIGEILKDGKTRREEYDDNPQTRAVAAFGKIYGVGPERANQLWDMGARSLQDLRSGDYNLTAGQKLGLEYYDDLNTRIPRDEVTTLFEIIKTEALKLDPKLMIDPMGSYRRGESSSGDLDILVSRDDTKDKITHASLLRKLVNVLHGMGVLEHCVSEPRDWDSLEAKWMGTGRVERKGLLRRIDILCIPYDSYGAALIYFTGNDHFNRSLRLYANRKGYSLNQRGLYKGVCRDSKTRLKTTEGSLVAAAQEQDIFDELGIRYRPPNLRRP